MDPSITSAFKRRLITLDFFQTGDVAMERVLVRAQRLARLETPVLISGEPGSGKSMLAQAVHNASARASQPIRVVGPADVGLSDLRSSLLGNEEQVGTLDQANGGSLVLDDLQAWPEEVQLVFEQYLDTGEFPHFMTGGRAAPQLRLIATVSCPEMGRSQMPAGMAPGLYQRMRSGELGLPPLVARPADLPRLSREFLRRYSAREQQGPARLSAAAEQAVLDRRWYGNLRELDQAMRAAAMSVGPGGTVEPRDLPPPLEPLVAERQLPYRIDQLEEWAYARALRVAAGNRRQAIELLGVAPATFYRKAKRYGLLN